MASSRIGSNCRIGPLTHLRDGTILEDDVEVGAFVEIKQSHLGRGTIVRHLAYLGNAEVGEAVNIGATAITANFDGVQKFQTVIGDRSRVGAGAILVAPVTSDRIDRRGQRRRHQESRRRRRTDRGRHPGEAPGIEPFGRLGLRTGPKKGDWLTAPDSTSDCRARSPRPCACPIFSRAPPKSKAHQDMRQAFYTVLK